MTEKEKAAAGLLYQAFDEGLTAERVQAQDLCYDYNLLRPSQLEERTALLDALLGSHKGEFLVEQPFHCDYGYNIHIGTHFYANCNCVILDEAPVVFGDHVLIAPNCGFYTAGHPMTVAERNTGLEYAKPIRIGNNVWIGANVCVLPGVTIGDNTVIAAGSVVNRDIPAGVLAAGNPCRVVREIQEKPRRMIL